MRVIQGAINEVKAIQPSATHALLALLPPGAPHTLQQVETEAGGQGASALLQGQEKLHQEGKAALRTLSCTRETLRQAMEKELQEQRELRAHCRAFFRSVISSRNSVRKCFFCVLLLAMGVIPCLHLSQLFVLVPVVSV